MRSGQAKLNQTRVEIELAKIKRTLSVKSFAGLGRIGIRLRQ